MKGKTKKPTRVEALTLIFAIGCFIILVALWSGFTPSAIKYKVDIMLQPPQNTTEFNNATLFIPRSIADVLNTRYSSDIQEFVYCLYGEKKGDTFHINSVKSTTVLSTDKKQITFERCWKDSSYLGTIHSHPAARMIGSCGLSEADAYTFGDDDSWLMGIVCAKDSYSFYTFTQLDRSLKYEIVEGK